MSGTPLPEEVPRRLQHSTHVVSAYNKCLRLQKSLQAKNDKVVAKDLIYVRILGYLIHYASDAGSQTVVQEISSCEDDSKMLAVGKVYYDHYIRAFRANKGRVRTPNHSSRPSFDKIQEMISANLVQGPQSHVDAKKNALIRDGFRCVVTGSYDRHSVDANQELIQLMDSDPSLSTTATDSREYRSLPSGDYIFAESTNMSISGGSDKLYYGTSMWAVMARFGHEQLPVELNGSNIHRLENVMTLDGSFRILFDDMGVWFIATEEENKYRLEGRSSIHLRRYPKYVTFTTPDPINLPVPSPTYLSIHATCAKVAHLSGATEYIDKFCQDMEDLKTLDPNGASAEILEHAISRLQVFGYMPP